MAETLESIAEQTGISWKEKVFLLEEDIKSLQHEIQILNEKYEISEEQKKRILRQQIEQKVSQEILQRKYGEIQEISRNAKQEAEDNWKKIQTLRSQLIEKDVLLEKTAQRLMIYQVKVSNLEERLYKFIVRRPGAEAKKTIISISKNPGTGKIWFVTKDGDTEEKYPLTSIKEITMSDRPLNFCVHYIDSASGDEKLQTFISENRRKIAQTIKECKEICNED